MCRETCEEFVNKKREQEIEWRPAAEAASWCMENSTRKGLSKKSVFAVVETSECGWGGEAEAAGERGEAVPLSIPRQFGHGNWLFGKVCGCSTVSPPIPEAALLAGCRYCRPLQGGLETVGTVHDCSGTRRQGCWPRMVGRLSILDPSAGNCSRWRIHHPGIPSRHATSPVKSHQQLRLA